MFRSLFALYLAFSPFLLPVSDEEGTGEGAVITVNDGIEARDGGKCCGPPPLCPPTCG